MIHDYLEEKIRDSKEVLTLAAQISKEYYHKPLIITYSGGKDSDVLLQLAMECLKPDEFEVLNSHTTFRKILLSKAQRDQHSKQICGCGS